ncbi:MAG: polysaccharide biosynthesis protein [Deltaproteobacteria bacterium]|nr:polysaccharide biosynthesis protein [Deltaproteobacteria bacterium]
MRPVMLFSRAAQHILDLLILVAAFGVAYVLRFEGIPKDMNLKMMFFQWPYAVLLGIASYYLFGVYRYIWRYLGLAEVRYFALAHAAVGGALLAARLGLPDKLIYAKVPISIIVINAFLAFLGSVGVRATHRLMVERGDRKKREQLRPADLRQRVLLIGAGDAGNLAAKELHGRSDLGMEPIGFVDDDPVKQGRVIQDLKVLGPVDVIPSVVGLHKVDMLLITVASITGPQMRRIKEVCDRTRLPTKILPGLYELIDGTVSVNRIRDVDIEDLLGREAVHLDEQSISAFIKGKVVLVSGAGGSIGSEMCRQICRFAPERILLVEQAETPLFDIHRELLAKGVTCPVVPLIADICDSERIRQLFKSFSPQVVIHAAAHKHVPMMEWNPGEAIKNNVFGTRKLADVSIEAGVERFIMISTDKAVNPTSVMGASKRIAEMYLQSLSATREQVNHRDHREHRDVSDTRQNASGAFSVDSVGSVVKGPNPERQVNHRDHGAHRDVSGVPEARSRSPSVNSVDSVVGCPTRFVTVRFGNVLGSAGSVIPIFKEQIRKGGPLTVTHPDMTRYFMTIPEASQLVLQAAAMGRGGEVFVLDMGEPVKIVDLAKDLVRLSGLEEDEIEIVFTGLRPGEKLFEEISLSCEEFDKTLHPKIFTGRLAPVDRTAMERHLAALHQLSNESDHEAVTKAIKRAVPEYNPSTTGIGGAF